MPSAKDKQKENKKKRLAVQKKYSQRITIARQGFEAFRQKDYITAAAKYKEYLTIFSDLNDYDDIYKISPTNFDHKTEITEMLLISHVYWELSRINESAPELSRNFQRSLNQFVKFTINQPYQVFNAEMLRRYIKKQKGAGPKAAELNQAYKAIFIQSKKCYISTFCYGQEHPITLTLRDLKSELVKFDLGIKFVEIYYRTSTRFVSYLQKKPLLTKITLIITRPILFFLAKILDSSIVKLCFYSRK